MLRPASAPPADPRAQRLLHVDPVTGALEDGLARGLPARLRPGDLVVVNDAATLPASLAARGPDGGDVEVRLLSFRDGARFRAVLLGAGDWRTPTERRPPPGEVAAGDRLELAGGLAAEVEARSPLSPRLVDLRFDRDGAALWSALYARGRPVQYAHVPAPLRLDDVQTAFAGRPWAAEMPSAGRPLRHEVLAALRRLGHEVVALTHAAGPSATGDPAIDAALPLPERSALSPPAALAVRRARRDGRRVVAVGTSVVRALEAAALAGGGEVAPGEREVDLVLGPGSRLRVVDGVLTGVHEPGSTHLSLLHAFAPDALLRRALAHAEAAGYLGHELGDACLVLPR